MAMGQRLEVSVFLLPLASGRLPGFESWKKKKLNDCSIRKRNP
jgi:hypothetical protein